MVLTGNCNERAKEYNKPFVSIITIVKNNEKTIGRAIESVILQSFKNFEYIIVNDGSTDATKTIIDGYKSEDNRIKPVQLDINVGRANARNIGLKAAKGYYIFFIDSDDYVPLTAILDLTAIATNDKADIVYGGIKCFDDQTGKWVQKHYTEDIINHEKHNFRLEEHLDLVNNHQIVGRLFKRNLLKKHNIKFSTERKNGEDVNFSFYTSFFAKRMTMVPHKIVYFYSIGNYLSKANESKLFDARDNLFETVVFANKYGSASIVKTMQKKAVLFSGNLERAQKVYEKQEKKMIEYIKSLIPLIEGIQKDTLKMLPPYYQTFAKLIIKRDYNKAYQNWKYFKYKQLETNNNRSNIDLVSEKITGSEFVKNEYENDENVIKYKILSQEISLLSQMLDELYHSNSWRITAPLRFIKRNLKRLK